VTIVFNPQARGAIELRGAIDRAMDLWQSLGWHTELVPTQCAGDGTRIARQAAAGGANIVIAVGGDGTVNEVVNGLVGSDCALGVLPAGTVNIWAREMGLPMNIDRAARLLPQSSCQRIDVGLAKSIPPRVRWHKFRRRRVESGRERYFLLMAGIGFDAAVTANIDLDRKKSLGVLAYVGRALQMLATYRGTKLLLDFDGRKISQNMLMAVVGNSQLYGGAVEFTHHAKVDDGWLDICTIAGNSMLKAPLRLLAIATRSHALDPRIDYHRAKIIQIYSRRAVPIQLDGDYFGTTPIRLEILPASLWILVPPAADRSLFTTVADV
jgi:diacylglycerol kinase (ATP)